MAVDFLGLSLEEVKKAQKVVFNLIGFVMSMVPHYEIVDYIFNSTNEV